MKTVILCGGYGTRLSEETKVFKTNGSNWQKTNFEPHYGNL